MLRYARVKGSRILTSLSAKDIAGTFLQSTVMEGIPKYGHAGDNCNASLGLALCHA
jgi:hypothetical protein